MGTTYSVWQAQRRPMHHSKAEQQPCSLPLYPSALLQTLTFSVTNKQTYHLTSKYHLPLLQLILFVQFFKWKIERSDKDLEKGHNFMLDLNKP